MVGPNLEVDRGTHELMAPLERAVIVDKSSQSYILCICNCAQWGSGIWKGKQWAAMHHVDIVREQH